MRQKINTKKAESKDESSIHTKKSDSSDKDTEDYVSEDQNELSLKEKNVQRCQK